MIEQDTRFIIDNNLINKGWILDINNPSKNVFFETDISRIINNPKLKQAKKRPDYVLIDENKKPIGIIEAKSGGKNLEKALDQAMEYAEILEAPLIFAMNNGYCQTRHLYHNKPLYINENEVNEIIRQTEALKFLTDNTNEIYTIPKQVIVSRKELINIFKNLNNNLRGEGIRAGIERLSEFANILFLKLYTENKNENIWNDLKNTPNGLLIQGVNTSLRLIEKEYGASVFTEVQIKKPETLRDIIKKLDNLQLSTINSDIKGDAFEYFLQQATATSNDLGEYFTPRHITKTIVNLVNPKFKEKIYDPFCGTGGILIGAFNHIKENTIIEKDDEDTLKKHTIFGNEITTNARLAKMNMILHGDGHSGVEQKDSLENPIDNEFDIVITNMPFAQKTAFSSLYYNGLSKGKGDSVCVLHCFRAVKKGGRMALIVPEGFLFNKQYRDTRRFLLKNSKLQTIVSLPQGVFLPYTGVKTNILFFIDCHSGQTKDSVWSFNVKSDGFSLDNHREKVKSNDLKVVDYVDFKKNTDETIQDIGFEIIDFKEIEKNDYNLVIAKYLKNEYNSKYDMVRLGDVITLLRGPFGSSIKKEVCVSQGYKLYEQGNVIANDFNIGKYYLDEAKYQQLKKFEVFEGDILVTCAGTLGKIAIVPKSFEQGIINSVLMRFRILDKSILLPNYLKLVLESDTIQNEMITKSLGTSIKNMRAGSEIKDLMIPLPSIKEQLEIIKNIAEVNESIERKKIEMDKMNNQLKSVINSIWTINNSQSIASMRRDSRKEDGTK